jgi:hypothetical protein
MKINHLATLITPYLIKIWWINFKKEIRWKLMWFFDKNGPTLSLIKVKLRRFLKLHPEPLGDILNCTPNHGRF